MAKCYRSELVGVFGYPVDENPTVVTMEAGFQALGLNYRYCTMEVRPENLETALKGIKALGFRGTNLTIPHKVEVLQYLDEITDSAKLIGAVNTVYIQDGKLCGENTDGKGFIVSLEENNIPIAGKKVMILGAGGASRAIAVELALKGAAEIIIVNRTAEKGQALADHIDANTPAKARFIRWDHAVAVPADVDILVQATNIGLYPDESLPDIDYSTLRQGLVACDIIPNPPQTGFLKQAEAKGCRTLDGLSMLVNQGAIGFKIWTGQDAPVEAMKEATQREFV